MHQQKEDNMDELINDVVLEYNEENLKMVSRIEANTHIKEGINLFDCELNEVEPRELYFHGSTKLFSTFKFGAEVECPACFCGAFQHSVSITDDFSCALHFAQKGDGGSYIYLVRPLEGCTIISQPFVPFSEEYNLDILRNIPKCFDRSTMCAIVSDQFDLDF